MLLGLSDVRVEEVERAQTLTVTVSTPWQLQGCPECGVVAPSRGRRRRVLHDVPHGDVRVRVVWRQRVWRCPEVACSRGSFVEQVPDLVTPRGSITGRAITRAIGQLRREHATIAGLARRLGVSWWALWRVVKPELERLAADESRFAGVTSLGVDEHVWHHGDRRTKGPKELTGMVDLTRDERGRVHARLLDLVPGRSKKAYADWLDECGHDFRKNIDVAAMDPVDNADDRHEEVFVAWQCAQQLRAAYQAKDLADGRRLAENVLASFHTCPIPEVARLGRTLRN